MDCWLHKQRPVNGENNVAMSSFVDIEPLLEAQWFWQELYDAANNSTPLSILEPNGSFNLSTFNFNEEETGFQFETLPTKTQEISTFNGEDLQQCGFESESLPTQMQWFGDSKDEDFGYSELNLPAWQTDPTVSELRCGGVFTERPRNNSFYTLEDVMEKLPRVSPLPFPISPMSPGILPPPHQFSSSDVRFSSCLPFSARVSSPPMSLIFPSSPQFSLDLSFSPCRPLSGRISCSPASLQPSEEETEHLNQLTGKRQNPSVEPQSIAARHRRSKIREKIRSLEKLIPQGSKLDTARMLDEAIKYLKFLKAQVQVLEDYADSKPGLKYKNPNVTDSNANIWLKPNFTSEYAFPMQISGSAAASSNSTDQIIHVLLSSSRIQRQLFSTGKVIVTVQQKEKLSSTLPDLFSS